MINNLWLAGMHGQHAGGHLPQDAFHAVVLHLRCGRIRASDASLAPSQGLATAKNTFWVRRLAPVLEPAAKNA